MKKFMYVLSAALLATSASAFADAGNAHTGLIVGGNLGLSAAQTKLKVFNAAGGQMISKTSKKSRLQGGISAQYGIPVMDGKVVVGPQIGLTLGGVNLPASQTIAGTEYSLKLIRRFQVNVGGYARYLVTPQTAIGADLALLIAPFRTEVNTGSNGYKSNKTNYGVRFGLGVDQAVSERVTVGVNGGYSMYQTMKWSNVGTSNLRVENKPSSFDLMLNVKVKVAG